jgi:hypothetical protein
MLAYMHGFYFASYTLPKEEDSALGATAPWLRQFAVYALAQCTYSVLLLGAGEGTPGLMQGI